MGSGWINVAAALALTLGLLAVAVYLLRRVQTGSGGGAKGVPLQVLKRVPVGPKQGIALVRVADRVLVVSIADGGTRLLTELQDQALQDALEPPRPSREAGRPASFRLHLLSRLGLIAILLLSPVAARVDAAPVATPRTPTTAPAASAASAPASRPLRSLAGMRSGRPTPSPSPHIAITAPVPPKVDITIGEGANALHLTGAVGLVVFIGVLTLLPALFLLMTSFTRILIVLQFLRPALGTQTSPPSQLLVALAVLLTGVVMNPVLQETNRVALQPYFNGQITQADAYKLGVKPFREFMLANTRDKDLAMFTEMSGVSDAESIDDVPIVTVVSAFVTSELRTAFQMGFVIFLPFIVVDIVVASVLMSLGMFMLPPMMVSLPFKLLLFVLADGWTLVVQNLVTSFR